MTNVYGIKLPIPCVYNDKPKPVTNSTILELIHSFLPEYNNTNVFCCKEQDFMAIINQLSTARNMMSRCPSCYYNFARIFMTMSCHPNQDEIILVTDFDKNDKAVKSIDYFVTEDYVNAVYQSCIDVVLPSSGNKVITGVLCQKSDEGVCTPKRFFQTVGKNDVSPIQINFKYGINSGNGVPVYSNISVAKCSEAPTTFSSLSCSCIDCSPVCPVPEPIPTDPEEWTILGVRGIVVLMVIFYVLILIATVGLFVGFKFFKKDDLTSAILDDKSEETIRRTTEPHFNQHQSAFHKKIWDAFGSYGALCATKPYCYIFPLVGILIASVLSVGMIKFDPITDPIKLWSTESSRARIEKRIFDENFGPFFRIENVVITPTFMDIISDGNLTYGPVFNQTFLLKVLELQQEIMDIKIDDNGTKIEDICFSPMNNNICMVQSALGWFQAKRELLNSSSYLKHINNCIYTPLTLNDSLGLSCLASYGGPVFPHIVLGDYPENNYTSAKALVLTFMLNNHIDSDQNQNALKWEYKFLELLKNYNDSYMKLAFYSEVICFLIDFYFINFASFN